jgi:hypothetical protein
MPQNQASVPPGGLCNPAMREDGSTEDLSPPVPATPATAACRPRSHRVSDKRGCSRVWKTACRDRSRLAIRRLQAETPCPARSPSAYA